MVLVASIALGSSTYAWFVSNNRVDATTTSISAQSNAAYLVIDNAAKGKTDKTSTSSVTASENPVTTKLFPAQVIADGVWQSAYALAPSASTEASTGRFTIKDGTADKAVEEKYALKNTFYIGTGGYDGQFKDLKVSSVSVSSKTNTSLYTIATNSDAGYMDEDTTYAYVTGTTPTTAADYITKARYEAMTTTSELVNAVRVLVECDGKWVVWQNGGQVSTYKTATDDAVALTGQAEGGVLASSVVKGTDKTVNVYVYYDGADQNVFSDNLADLRDCGVTITFDATPVTYGVGA